MHEAYPPVSGTRAVNLSRVSLQEQVDQDDRVAVEAPLEFQLHHPQFGPEPISFGATMRTPGDDEWLAAGLLYGEGIVNRPTDIDAIESSTRRPNVVNVRLNPDLHVESPGPAHRFSAGSSCGVCGTTGLDASIARAAAIQIRDAGIANLRVLLKLPASMRAAQSRFGDTGGIHAAALFDYAGTLRSVAEDVGRHNAFDKLVGENFMAGHLPLRDHIVLLSGRVSFELVQKGLRAGVSILAAIGAPSSLAVNLAVASGMTLIGFIRNDHCNIYAGRQRISINQT